MTKQKIRATSFRMGQVSIQSCYNLVSEIIQFSAKKKLRCAKKEESMAHTQGKTAVNKNYSRGRSDIRHVKKKKTLNIFIIPNSKN